jgi:hypothetical protein
VISPKRLVVGSVVLLAPMALGWWLRRRPKVVPVTGVVVTQEGGLPLSGVRVEARHVLTFTVLAGATTGASGEFTLAGMTEEEFGVWVDGSSRGCRRGYVAADGSVVPTWGEAVSWGPASFPLRVRLAAA